MKIKLNQPSSGPGGNKMTGAIIEVDDETGKYLIETRQGEKVVDLPAESVVVKEDARTFETATVPDTPETATTPNRRKPKVADSTES